MKQYVVQAGGADFLFSFDNEGLMKAQELAIAENSKVYLEINNIIVALVYPN